jgi:hypothetical protein
MIERSTTLLATSTSSYYSEYKLEQHSSRHTSQKVKYDLLGHVIFTTVASRRPLSYNYDLMSQRPSD